MLRGRCVDQEEDEKCTGRRGSTPPPGGTRYSTLGGDSKKRTSLGRPGINMGGTQKQKEFKNAKFTSLLRGG